MPSIFFVVLVVTCLFLRLSQPAQAQAVGSFYFGKGSAVVAHNPDASNFLYSINSAKGFSDMQSIEVKAKPKNGTAIACTGYSGPTSVYGQVFYQSTNSSLAFLFFKCSYASGICINYGEHIISSNISPPISPNTELAAALFSKDIGYRVTYQDVHGSLRQLAYANNTQGVVTDWADGNLTGNLTVPDGAAIATTYVSPSNVTGIREVLYAVGEEEVRSSRALVENKTNSIRDQKSWVENPPIPLPSPIAHLTTLTYNSWDCIFYIDSTSHLQFLRSTNGGESWSLQPQMDLSAWPLADSPNAPLTAVASFNKSDFSAYVYYRSGGKLVQAKIKDALWEDAVPVQAPPNGTFIASNNVPGLNSPSGSNSSRLNLKIGAGVGAAAVFVLVLAIATFLLRRKRHLRNLEGGIEKRDSIFESKDNSSSEYGFSGMCKAELCGVPSGRVELDHDPECKLLHQLQVRRLGELESDLGRERRELEGDGGRERDVVCELASPVSELGDERWERERKENIDAVVADKENGEKCENGGVVSELDAGPLRERGSGEMKIRLEEKVFLSCHPDSCQAIV
ncbi:hypothetical protein BKA64DRAFT_382429 [Cadophora sp. MPI-SDFR-AT-0126]|nr:hypothetical protein BKA64DRAFT_382429 [Leotiomycetes sp. MPI-SDFR-AT-0126]